MKKYELKNLDCANCAVKIEENLRNLNTTRFVSVNFADSSLIIDTEDIAMAKSKIKEIEPGIELIESLPENTSAGIPVFFNKDFYFLLSIVLVYLSGLIFQNEITSLGNGIPKIIIFISVYILAGWRVLFNAGRKIIRGSLFDENFLMSVATLGAIIIGDLAEAAGVMIFYKVGEYLQQLSLQKSRRSIKSLLEIKPSYANLKLNGEVQKVNPEAVKINQTILVKPGEKIPLDGEIIDGSSQLDTSPLTGESLPKDVNKGDIVLSGTINKSGLLLVKVTKLFRDSSVAKMLELIENATNKKAETEKFITSFSRYYTPVVTGIALAVAFFPPLLFGYNLSEWVYRALVLLVISCPCALVISIPLGYFGGIGASSRKGILIKGSNFLDALTEVKTVVFDKTGTLTKGSFKVTDIITKNGFDKDELLRLAAIAESQSNHPLAKSIKDAYGKEQSNLKPEQYTELPGFGILTWIDGKKLLAGNDLLLHKENIEHYDCNLNKSVVHIAVDNKYAGYIAISDEVKDDAIAAVTNLRKDGVDKIYMLTGDNQFIAKSISEELKLDGYFAELLPEQKVTILETLTSKHTDKHKTAFVGDGINDAPVIARADVGIAMGAFGSDLAIETADVVLMTDKPSKVAEAIKIAKRTRTIVLQNIFFALFVKAVFIVMGSFGEATMWEAVFADMGVALLAILNSLRVLKVE
ncbi:MAG: cadmium-translocating P-type ATPase [Ignavibacteriales bacterium]|nr:MAG: cadmium-translocating P-type ATPase [Ignavibacteriales bacterium]